MPHFRLSARVRRVFWVLCSLSLFLSVWLDGFLGMPAAAPSPRTRAVAVAQSTDVGQLVQSGIDRYELGLFSEAIEQWQAAYEIYEATKDLPALAVVSENIARAYQQLGQPTEEMVYWNRAIAATKSSDSAVSLNNASKLGRLLVEQAQTYSRLGQPRRAIAILCGSQSGSQNKDCIEGSALQIATIVEDTSTQIAALGSLGEAYRLLGNEQAAIERLEQGLDLSRSRDNQGLESAILNGLGTVYLRTADIQYRRADEASAQGVSEAADLAAQAKADTEAAIAYLQQSYDIAVAQQDEDTQLRALINIIPAEVRIDRVAAEQRRMTAIALVHRLPDSQVKAYALLQLAELTEIAAPTAGERPLQMTSLSAQQAGAIAPSVEAEMTQLLNQAMALGEVLESAQVTAFAVGKLGYLDERAGRYEDAIARTQSARLAANQNATAGESLYLWDWQMGRLLSATGQASAAKQAYAQAVAALEKVRSETLSISRDLQFDFRDTVEPIYRRYAALNLDEVPSDISIQKGMAAFEALDNTLATIDALKVAELQNYFANDCIIAPVVTRVDALDNNPATAVISTAVLSGDSFDSRRGSEDENREQLVAIASLSDGSKKVVQIEADKQTVEDSVIQFRYALELGSRGDFMADYDQTPGRQLYQWFVQPFEQDFSDIKTLVFVNDGLLRSVPMAALYDGNQFLIEKFAIATTPSLTLTNPKRVERPARLSALLMGVSESSRVRDGSFASLPGVDEEIAQVAKIFPNSEVLFNEALSLSALRNSLEEKDYRILHMATHGTFGFDPNDNYVVLGAKQADADGLNQVLTISELDEIIRETSGPARSPIELLTLTACETAVGDTRSTLGLAGVAVRAGVRSAIATLWSVGDESSAQLISDFYNNFKEPQLTKAEALQQAQVAMLRSEDLSNRHPYHWAPFVLIGNWL